MSEPSQQAINAAYEYLSVLSGRKACGIPDNIDPDTEAEIYGECAFAFQRIIDSATSPLLVEIESLKHERDQLLSETEQLKAKVERMAGLLDQTEHEYARSPLGRVIYNKCEENCPRCQWDRTKGEVVK